MSIGLDGTNSHGFGVSSFCLTVIFILHSTLKMSDDFLEGAVAFTYGQALVNYRKYYKACEEYRNSCEPQKCRLSKQDHQKLSEELFQDPKWFTDNEKKFRKFTEVREQYISYLFIAVLHL
jgi:hypothetical protein